MKEPQSKNLFISLEIPDGLKHELIKSQEYLPKDTTRQPLDQLHLTLGYFANTAPEQEEEIKKFLQDSVGEQKIPLAFNGHIAHNSWSRTNDPDYQYDESTVQREEQIRMGVKPGEELMQLQNMVTEFAKEKGLLPPDFSLSFSPHITIGEAKSDFSMDDISDLKIPSTEQPAELITLQQEIDRLTFKILEEYRFDNDENKETKIPLR